MFGENRQNTRVLDVTAWRLEQVVEADGRAFAPVVTHINLLLPPEGPVGDKRPVQVDSVTASPPARLFWRCAGVRCVPHHRRRQTHDFGRRMPGCPS